jgi:large subunit ribosomal protein L4
MDLTVTTLEGKDAGKISLSDAIFGLEPRQDLIQRIVRWQLAKKQQGGHKTLGRSEIARTGAKMFKQKGTGRARHHAASAPQFRGGGRAHGPVSAATLMIFPRRFVLWLCVMRFRPRPGVRHHRRRQPDRWRGQDQGADRFADKLGLTNALFIGGAELDQNFRLAAKNIPNVDVLPVQGINVYDILRRGKLVLSKDAVAALEERFK